MPVGTTEASTTYKLNGTAKIFDFTFHVDDPQDVKVRTDDGQTVTALTYVASGPLLLNEDYAVNVNNNRVGGTITLFSAFTDLIKLTIYREVDYIQDEVFVPYESFKAEDFENVADKATMFMQQLRSRIEEQNI